MLVRYLEIVKQDPSFLPFAIERIEPLKDWGHLTEEINNALNELKSTQTGEQNIGCDNCGTYDRRQNSKYCHFCLTEWPHLEDE